MYVLTYWKDSFFLAASFVSNLNSRLSRFSNSSVSKTIFLVRVKGVYEGNTSGCKCLRGRGNIFNKKEWCCFRNCWLLVEHKKKDFQ